MIKTALIIALGLLILYVLGMAGASDYQLLQQGYITL